MARNRNRYGRDRSPRRGEKTSWSHTNDRWRRKEEGKGPWRREWDNPRRGLWRERQNPERRERKIRSGRWVRDRWVRDRWVRDGWVRDHWRGHFRGSWKKLERRAGDRDLETAEEFNKRRAARRKRQSNWDVRYQANSGHQENKRPDWRNSKFYGKKEVVERCCPISPEARVGSPSQPRREPTGTSASPLCETESPTCGVESPLYRSDSPSYGEFTGSPFTENDDE